MTQVITGDGIKRFQALTRLKALELELKGLKRRGRSAYSIIKEVYGLKGTRQRVRDQLRGLIDDWEVVS